MSVNRMRFSEFLTLAQTLARIVTVLAVSGCASTQSTNRATTPPAAPSEGPPISPPAGLPQATAKVAEMADRESLSPAVRRMVEEFQQDTGAIAGTGREGRITKEDVVRHVQTVTASPAQPEPVAPKAAPPKAPAPAAAPPPATPGQASARRENP